MGATWNGIEERPIDGIGRMRATSWAIVSLIAISVVACTSMIVLGSSPFLFLLAWFPLIVYLYFCAVWVRGLPGYTIWRSYIFDRVWAGFWLDEGNLEIELESRFRRESIPFQKECRWSYFSHYRFPEGLGVGVVRLSNGRSSERVLLMIEGVNEQNWDLTNVIFDTLTGLDIGQVAIHGQPISASAPWGFTTRA